MESHEIELEIITEYRTQGAIKRAKVRWYNEGEKKNTSYFLNLEKRDCKQRTNNNSVENKR